jgi:CheY-like chemotaxis protein
MHPNPPRAGSRCACGHLATWPVSTLPRGILAALTRDAMPPTSDAPLRLLVVDDSEILLRAMTRMLQRSYAVTTACDGVEALDLIRQGGTFDVIVCDVSMPRMNGVEFYTRLLHDYPDAASRFMFATGGATTLRSMQFLLDARVRVLLKPVTPDALRGAIDAFAPTTATATRREENRAP